MTKTKKTTKKLPLLNRVAIVIDNSGSMYGKERTVVNEFNRLLNTLKAETAKTGQQTKLSTYVFNSTTTTYYVDRDVETVGEWNGNSYLTGGNTALYDAVGKAITALENSPYEGVCDVSNVLIVITDGQENNSRIFTKQAVVELVTRLNANERYTLTFMGPNGCKAYALRMGFLDGDVAEWQTEKEYERRGQQMVNSMQSLYSTRAAGGTHIKTMFYKDIDLGGVTATKLKKELDDVTHQFKKYEVVKEDTIAPFVEAKTKRPYAKGRVFYQLSKKELVQPYKEIVIEHKVSKKVFGGDEVYNVLGLPYGQACKISPLNVSEYNVFVQSTSTNRKLVRGTSVLVRN